MELAISNPMTASSVKVYRAIGYLYRRDNRRFWTLVPISMLVCLQLIYMIFSDDELDRLALNLYFSGLLSNCLFRAVYTCIHANKFQKNLENLCHLYRGILESNDEFAQKELLKTTYRCNLLHRTNIIMCTLCGLIYIFYPFTSKDKSHPYGIYIGGVDMKASPTYEIVYWMEAIITIALGITYILFVNLFTSFILFGFALVKILYRKFEGVSEGDYSSVGPNNRLIALRLRLNVEIHLRLIRYVEGMNEIFSTNFLAEIIIFGLLLCALLFLLINVQKGSQIFLTVFLLLMIFTQLFIIYWMSNEITEQSARLQCALYNTPWYDFDTRNKRTILLILCRTQRPLHIMIGNFAPMTLNLFQSILNASYSYFTILRRTLM